MASEVLKYKVYCETDSKWETWYLPADSAAPTTCPTNSGHTITTALTSQSTYTKSSDVDVASITTDPKAAPSFAPAPRPNVSQFIDCSHNWADKTTWHTNALQKTAQTLTNDSGNTLGLGTKAYFYDDSGAVPFWIDANHFKLYREESRHLDKVVKVYDNGVEVAVAGFGEDKDSAGIDCEVDYVIGAVVFNAGYTVTGPVTADFWHVDGSLSGSKQSEYSLHPPIDHLVILERVETQFTQGISVDDSTHFAGFTYLNYIAIQTDATLDPTAYSPLGDSENKYGMAFLITDKDNLHENFGTIDGIGNNDIVMYATGRDGRNADAYVVWFDASEETSGVAMNAILGSSPAPTIKTWNGTVWSAEGYGAPVKYEIPETRDTYNTFQDYLNDATGNYSYIPAGFSTGLRGCAHGILQIPFDWLGSKHIDDAKGVELRIWLKDGVEFGPDRTHFATASFYGQIYKS